ncbi:MAG TPA: NAD(P)/FAD-dependent oxidoreductase [Streptosporangiaceae bacterium]
MAIVGAGISGMACAAALAKHDVRSVIFEARDAPGGRVRSYRPADGGPAVELGAQVIHGDRNPLLDLPGHGIPAAPSPRSRPLPRDAAAWAVLHGQVTSLAALARGGMPPWAAEQRLTADRRGLPCDGPDGGDVPVAAWLREQEVSGDHLLAAAEWFRQNWAAEPEVLSAGGVAAARRGDRCGDSEHAFDHGFTSLTEALAPACDIRLRAPVRSLTWTPGRAVVTVGDGALITARAAVITAPPPVVASGRLAITPWPAIKAAAAAALPSGDGLCAVVTLSRPVPRSAVVFDTDGDSGFVRAWAGRPEVLIVAKAGAAAAVRAADLAELTARVLPGRPAGQVTSVRMADWGRDPWSGGVFSYPKVQTAWAGPAWAAPLRRTLFFAGEATTAGSLPPTVHGALSSGLRAASEIVEAWGR